MNINTIRIILSKQFRDYHFILQIPDAISDFHFSLYTQNIYILYMFVFAKQIADEKFIGILSDTLTRKEVITTTTATATIISKTKSFLIV